MHDELGYQEQVLDRVTDHVDKTQTGLSDVQQSAEKTLGKKGMPLVLLHCFSATRHCGKAMQWFKCLL